MCSSVATILCFSSVANNNEFAHVLCCTAGVRNYVARNHLRAMKVGDKAFFYHSSCKVPGIVGIVEVSYPLGGGAFVPDTLARIVTCCCQVSLACTTASWIKEGGNASASEAEACRPLASTPLDCYG